MGRSDVKPGDVWMGPMGGYFAAYLDRTTGDLYLRGIISGKPGAIHLTPAFKAYMALDNWALVERSAVHS